ncbi:MAG: hypothetical protein R3B54_12920 [Bdellovibrionota bacterium]
MEQSFATLIVGVTLFTFATLVNVTKLGQDPTQDRNAVPPQRQESLLWNQARAPQKTPNSPPKNYPARSTAKRADSTLWH